MKVADFFRDFIRHWEDGDASDVAITHSLDEQDSGNWTSGICGVGQCVGSNHGVTAAALAAYRKVPVNNITLITMRALTLDEAAKIGEVLYYHAPGLDKLPWDPVVASVVDFGWGAGPVQAVKLLQRMIGVADDGQIGPYTVRAYVEYKASHKIEDIAKTWQSVRDGFYRLIVTKRPVTAKYLKGWIRRSAYYLPGSLWWKRFAA